MNLDWDDLKSMFIVTVGFIGGGGVGLAIFILAVGLVSAFLKVRIVMIVSLLLKADSPSKETNFNCPNSDFSKSNGIAKSSAKSKLSQSQEMPVENGLLVFRSKQKDSFLSQQVKPLELTLDWKNSPRSQKASQFKIRDFSEQTKKIWQRHNERKIESERHGFTKESKIAAMIFVIRYRLT